jgi:hypothetical protein
MDPSVRSILEVTRTAPGISRTKENALSDIATLESLNVIPLFSAMPFDTAVLAERSKTTIWPVDLAAPLNKHSRVMTSARAIVGAKVKVAANRSLIRAARVTWSKCTGTPCAVWYGINYRRRACIYLPMASTGPVPAKLHLVEATVVIRHALVATRCSPTATPHALIVVGFAHRRTAGDNDRAYFLRPVVLDLCFTIILDVFGSCRGHRYSHA